MDYKVIIPFIYTPTGKGYNEGSTFTIDDGERALALVEKGYLKASGVHVTTKQPDNDGLNNQQTSEQNSQEETSQQLKVKAKSLKIKGYTKMSDEQLQEAIAKEEAQKASD